MQKEEGDGRVYTVDHETPLTTPKVPDQVLIWCTRICRKRKALVVSIRGTRSLADVVLNT
jgi:hypothetical protein